MSDNFYSIELMAREKARWAEAEMQRRQMLTRARSARRSLPARLLRAITARWTFRGGFFSNVVRRDHRNGRYCKP